MKPLNAFEAYFLSKNGMQAKKERGDTRPLSKYEKFNTFQRNLVKLREKKELTIEALSERSCCSIRRLKEFERHHKNGQLSLATIDGRIPSVQTVNRIARALEVEMDELFVD